MLIAPFSISPSERSSVAPKSLGRARGAKRPFGVLIAWFVVGVGVLLLVPLARGDRLLGATLPFWLVVAPLVDLGWLERRRIALGFTRGLRRFASKRRGVRNMRAQRAPRAAACNAARS